MRGVIRWATHIGLGVVSLAVLATAIGWIWERWSEVRDTERFAPPGRLFDVGNGKRHIFCEGRGGPTAVLISGGGIPSILLRPLQDRVARFTRVCAYDRAGLGWSEPATRSLDITAHAAELRTLLAETGEHGPFVLVGHSMGGLIARRFAIDEPSAVAGMVLVDAAEEGVVFQSRFLDSVPAGVAQYKKLEFMARFGVPRVVVAANPAQARLPDVLTADERRQAVAQMVRPSFFQGSAEEARNAYTHTPFAMQRVGGFGRLGSVPLVVIRHGRAFTGAEAPMESGWAESQARLAALSSDSVTRVASGDGHLISEADPDLTATAVADVVWAVREHQRLNLVAKGGAVSQ